MVEFYHVTCLCTCDYTGRIRILPERKAGLITLFLVCNTVLHVLQSKLLLSHREMEHLQSRQWFQ